MCVFALGTSAAWAQVFGTFTWQTQPYCNRVTLTLSNSPAGFTLDGYRRTGAGPRRRPARPAVAVFNSGRHRRTESSARSWRLPTGQAVHIAAANVMAGPPTGRAPGQDLMSAYSGAFALLRRGAADCRLGRASDGPARRLANNPNQATNPCDVSTVRPTLLLCGTTAGRWRQWRLRPRLGCRGGATRPVMRAHPRLGQRGSSGPIVGDIMFVPFPQAFIPKRTLASRR